MKARKFYRAVGEDKKIRGASVGQTRESREE